MIDELFDFLQDGQSHTFSEILSYLRSKCHTPVPSEQKLQIGLAFLKKYGFVNSFMEKGTEFWFLVKSVAEFWKTIKQMEK
jgi:hypothetical protein